MVIMTDEEVNKINGAIRKACRDVLPYNAIREDAEGGTQVIADIVQEVWVKTLEKGDLEGKSFAIQTKNVIRDWMRRELPTMPVSQMTLQAADAEDEDSELLMPWDHPLAAASVCPEVIEKINTAARTEKVKFVHDAVKGLNRNDRRFVDRYLSKKQVHDESQRKRFERLVKKLKKATREKESRF